MTEHLPDLRRAAALFEELARARATAEAAPTRDDDLAALVAEHAADEAAEAAAVAECRLEVRRLEGDLRDVEARLQDRRGRRERVADLQAASAVQAEIAHLRSQRDGLEARLLVAWETVEKELANQSRVTATVATETGRIAGRREDLAARRHLATAAMDEITAELQSILRRLPPSLAARLNRLAARLGNPVAALANGGCEACGQHLPAQQVMDADRDRSVPTCAGCGRFIVARRGLRRGEWT